jgi:hypothetical protein
VSEKLLRILRERYSDGMPVNVRFTPDEARDVVERAVFDLGESATIDGWIHDVVMQRCRDQGWVKIYRD